MRSIPSWSARPAARPWRRTDGWPVGRRSISMSRQPIPRTPSPSTFDTASLAAHRPANVSGRSRTYRRSAGVRTRAEKRGPNRAIVPAIRSTLMMSMPSSVVPAGTAVATARPDRAGRPSRGSSPAVTVSPIRPLLDRDRLRQVPRLIDVRAASDRGVVREELQRDDGEDGAERLVRIGHPADIVGEALDLGIPLGRYRDDPRVPGAALHHVADELVVDGGPRGDRDERVLRVEERDGPMLQLAGRVALGVDV